MEKQESLRHDAAKGLLWTGVQTVGSRLMSLVVFVVLARLLEPKSFGTVALAAVAVMLMTVLVEQGLGQALIQREILEPAHYDSAFWFSLTGGFVLAGVLFATAGWVSEALGDPELAPVLRWLTLILPIKGLSSVPQAIFERNLEFRLLAQRTIFANAIGGMAGVAAAVAGFGVWSLVIQAVLSAAGGTALLWMRTSWRPGFNVSFPHLRDLFSFGVNITGSNLMAFASRNGDTLLIGAVLGSVPLGLYSVAYRVLLVMTDILTRSFATVTFPVFSRVQGDPARMQRGFFSATELAAAIAFPAFALTAVFAPELVDVIFGAQWTACVPVMQILTGIGALQTLTFFNVSVLKALGRADWVFRISSLNAVLCIVGFSITVQWGIEAVAASYVAAGLVIAPVSVLAVKKRLRFSTWAYARRLLGPVVATFAASALAYLGRKYAAPHLSSFALLSALTVPALLAYAIALRFAAPHTAHEAMRLIRRVFPALPQGGGRVAPSAEASP